MIQACGFHFSPQGFCSFWKWKKRSWKATAFRDFARFILLGGQKREYLAHQGRRSILCSGSHKAEIRVCSERPSHLLSHPGAQVRKNHFRVHLGCWQNPLLCGFEGREYWDQKGREAKRRCVSEQAAAVQLGLSPAEDVTLQDAAQNCPCTKRGNWAICPPTPVPPWL